MVLTHQLDQRARRTAGAPLERNRAETELLQRVVRADSGSRLTHLLHGGQDGDDGDDNQQLDEREPG